jgi:hypothetical protein
LQNHRRGAYGGGFDASDHCRFLPQGVGFENFDCAFRIASLDPGKETPFAGEGQGVETEQLADRGDLPPHRNRPLVENQA